MIKIDKDFSIIADDNCLKLVADNELTLQEAINEFERIEKEIEQSLKENIKEGEEQG